MCSVVVDRWQAAAPKARAEEVLAAHFDDPRAAPVPAHTLVNRKYGAGGATPLVHALQCVARDRGAYAAALADGLLARGADPNAREVRCLLCLF